MLSNFIGVEDAYLFLREFEEVCSMMCYPNVSIDSVCLKFISFALKDDAKKWIYSLPANSITKWDGLMRVFLWKYLPNSKNVKLRNEINQFVQVDRESFWKYLDRFKNLLSQCPHHSLDQSHLCQIIYEGLDLQNRTMMESMCWGEFLPKIPNDAWKIQEDLAKKAMQWEPLEMIAWTLGIVQSKVVCMLCLT